MHSALFSSLNLQHKLIRVRQLIIILDDVEPSDQTPFEISKPRSRIVGAKGIIPAEHQAIISAGKSLGDEDLTVMWQTTTSKAGDRAKSLHVI
jgi:hypothetical protein